jgi:integrase
VVRDLDDDGRVLWIPDSKTDKGRRRLSVPDSLRPYLQRLVRGKPPTELLFGAHDRDWPRHWVKRICAEAGVPVVTAHGQRGLHATLAVEAGVSSRAVADSLGHESFSTTAQSYAKAEGVGKARQQRTLRVLEGGKSATKEAA